MTIFCPQSIEIKEKLEGQQFCITTPKIVDVYVNGNLSRCNDYGFRKIVSDAFSAIGYQTNPYWDSVSIVFRTDEELPQSKICEIPYALSVIKWFQTFPDATFSNYIPQERLEAVTEKTLVVSDGVLQIADAKEL